MQTSPLARLVLAPVLALAPVVAMSGCASSPPPKAPFRTKVDGWVEKGELSLAVADERPIAPPPKTYETGPLGIPAPFGVTPERVVDEYVKLDEKYKITEWFLPDAMAASVRKMLPAPSSLPLGVERAPHGAAVRVETAGRTFEVQTDDTGHARLPLAEIAVATLERGEETATLTIDVADGGRGEVKLSRNDLVGIADQASRLPDYGLREVANGGAFWAVVAARAPGKLLREEASRRTALQLDEATARLLVDRTGTAELPDGARVDWSPPGGGAGGERPSARIEVSLEHGDQDSLAFVLRVTNEGAGPFHQLRARTRSNVRAADDVLLLFGRIEPGATVERRFAAPSPRALRNRAVTLELDFWEALGQAPPPVETSFEARWRR